MKVLGAASRSSQQLCFRTSTDQDESLREYSLADLRTADLQHLQTLPSAHASDSDSDSGSDSASSGSISPPPSPVNGLQTFHYRTIEPMPYSRAQLAAQPPKGAITLDQIAEWESERKKDPVARLAQIMLSQTAMGIVLVGRDAEREDQMGKFCHRRGKGRKLTLRSPVFNYKVKMKGLPVADQKASGRCWLFAACNVLRVFIARKHSEFELASAVFRVSFGADPLDVEQRSTTSSYLNPTSTSGTTTLKPSTSSSRCSTSSRSRCNRGSCRS